MLSQLTSSKILKNVPVIMGKIRRDMRKIAEQDLTILQFRIMTKLNRERRTNKQLADWVGIDKTTMSKAVGCLERKGLIEKEVIKEDRRGSYIRLTKEGKSKYGEISELARKGLEKDLESLTETEQKNIINALEKLVKVIVK